MQILLGSALNQRVATWAWAWDAFGYLLSESVTRLEGDVARLKLRYSRSNVYGSLKVSAVMEELLMPGNDRHLLSESAGGCWIYSARWHAQIGADGDLNALRVDLAREAPDNHPPVHMHPWGQPNQVRLSLKVLPPIAWFPAEIERLIYAEGLL